MKVNWPGWVLGWPCVTWSLLVVYNVDGGDGDGKVDGSDGSYNFGGDCGVDG